MPLPRKINTSGQEPSKSEPPPKPLYARVMDTLNRPGAALAGGLSELFTAPSKRKTGVVERISQNLSGERKDDFDKFLEERGVGDTTARAVAGFAGDLALDPLNLLPIGKLGKLTAKYAGKGLNKVIGKGAHYFSNYAELDDAAKATFKLADSRIQALPDVLATRMGWQASAVKRANPDFNVSQIKNAIAAQVNPNIYNTARSQQLAALAGDIITRHASPGRVVRGSTAKVRFGGAKIDPAVRKQLSQAMRGKVLPENIAGHLQRRLIDQQSPTFVESSPILQWLVKKPTNVFRELATVWRPKFHSANAIGNIENIYKSGTSVPRMLKAAPEVHRFNKAFTKATSLSPQQLQQVIPGTQVTLGNALQAFEQYGLQHGIGDLTGISPTAGANILDKTIDIAAKQAVGPRERLVDALSQGSIGKRTADLYRFVRDAGPKRFGDAIERRSKMLKYIDSLKQGKTPEQAVLDVQDALFNYRDITDFERNIREFMPFYTFTRKNLPLQATSLATSPRKWERIGDFTNAIENATTQESENLQPNAVPGFIQDMAGFEAGKSERGNPVFGIPNFAGQDINKLDVVNPPKMLRDWLGGLSPVAKAGIELPMNKTLFDQRQIWDEDYGPFNSYVKSPEAIQSLPAPMRNFLTRDYQEFKYGKPTGNVQNQTPAWLAYLMKQAPVGATMGKVSLSVNNPDALSNRSAGLSELTGLPIYEVSPQTIEKQLGWQEKNEKRLKTKDANQQKRTLRQRQELLDALTRLGIDFEQ